MALENTGVELLGRVRPDDNRLCKASLPTQCRAEEEKVGARELTAELPPVTAKKW